MKGVIDNSQHTVVPLPVQLNHQVPDQNLGTYVYAELKANWDFSYIEKFCLLAVTWIIS